MSDASPDDCIDFWFSTGSTYTYLAVSRLEQVAVAEDVRFDWRPFSDIERRAAMYGLPIRVPAPYPLKEFDLANRLALLGLRERWGKPYIRASYRRWFAKGQEPVRRDRPRLRCSDRRGAMNFSGVTTARTMPSPGIEAAH